AGEISGRLHASGSVKSIKAMGPYVNFFADWKKLGQHVLDRTLKEDARYGCGKKKGRVIIEFAHPNTHKAIHIGHARNFTLGEALSKIMCFAGHDVKRVNYQGDIGPHVARCLWGILNLGLHEPKDGKGRWLGIVYAKGSREASKYDVEMQIRQINKDLYAGKPELVKLWKKTRRWSLGYFEDIYRDFGIKFDRYYFESEVEGPSVKLARKLKLGGKAKESDGAIVMDLEKYGLGIYVLLTQDGTPLYSIKDFVLADLQHKEYRPDRIIHVVSAEQELHFRQLFKSLQLIKSPVAGKKYHLSYGLVNLESGKMKSREGDVVLYEDLKEKVIAAARKISKEKNKDLSKKDLDKTAYAVGMGALKYDMIKISPEKTIVFDWDRALRFEGNNAPYLQYTHARCCSILRKAGKKTGKRNASVLRDGKEFAVLRKVSEFPEIVEKSGAEMRPHYIATYAYELCDTFNEFYQHVPVLNSGKERGTRLALVKAVSITVRNALNLLGIEAPGKM
ncbi:MAG: arginine--tRNA ligase, partial [Candidatus Aenigmatarchaeota archaeon]